MARADQFLKWDLSNALTADLLSLQVCRLAASQNSVGFPLLLVGMLSLDLLGCIIGCGMFPSGMMHVSSTVCGLYVSASADPNQLCVWDVVHVLVPSGAPKRLTALTPTHIHQYHFDMLNEQVHSTRAQRSQLQIVV